MGSTYFLSETQILESLCKGVDPDTGAELETPRDPEVDALRLKFYAALQRIDRECRPKIERTKPVKPKPERVSTHPLAHLYKNAGLPWDAETDHKLLARWNDPDSPTITTLTKEFGRTHLALQLRLASLGVADDHNGVVALDVARGGQDVDYEVKNAPEQVDSMKPTTSSTGTESWKSRAGPTLFHSFMNVAFTLLVGCWLLRALPGWSEGVASMYAGSPLLTAMMAESYWMMLLRLIPMGLCFGLVQVLFLMKKSEK